MREKDYKKVRNNPSFCSTTQHVLSLGIQSICVSAEYYNNRYVQSLVVDLHKFSIQIIKTLFLTVFINFLFASIFPSSSLSLSFDLSNMYNLFFVPHYLFLRRYCIFSCIVFFDFIVIIQASFSLNYIMCILA